MLVDPIQNEKVIRQEAVFLPVLICILIFKKHVRNAAVLNCLNCMYIYNSTVWVATYNIILIKEQLKATYT